MVRSETQNSSFTLFFIVVGECKVRGWFLDSHVMKLSFLSTCTFVRKASMKYQIVCFCVIQTFHRFVFRFKESLWQFTYSYFASIVMYLCYSVTATLSSQVSSVATRFSECLNAATENSSDPDAVSALITSIFLEVMAPACWIVLNGLWHDDIYIPWSLRQGVILSDFTNKRFCKTIIHSLFLKSHLLIGFYDFVSVAFNYSTNWSFV